MNLSSRTTLGAMPLALGLTLIMAVGATAQVASLVSPDETPAPDAVEAVLEFADRDEAILAYAQCLRDNGLDVDDPQAGAGGARAVLGGGPDAEGGGIDRRSEEFVAANESCGHLLEAARPEIDPEAEQERLEQQLDSGQIDIAKSCIAALPDRFSKASFSRSYLDLRLALIVRDHQRDFFKSLEKLSSLENMTIAMVSTHYFTPWISSKLPKADFVYLEAAEEFFTRRELGADALLLSAEEGAAYAYRYPQFHVVPLGQNGGVRLPAAYAVPRGDLEMMELVSNWIDLKRKNATIDELYDYWMLGGAAQNRQPRWSVIRDVLHWID